MPIFKQITAAKKTLYLETLAETGRYGEAVQAAGIDPSLPHYWRRTDPAFVEAENQAKQKAAQHVLLAGRTQREQRKLPGH